MTTNGIPKSFEEAFIKISFEEERDASSSTHDPAYGPWIENASAKRAGTDVWAADTLRKLHPGHSVVVTSPYSVGILGFPDLLAEPISADEVITETFFIPLAKRSAPIPGIVLDQVLFGAFRLAWDKYDFILYVVQFPNPYPEPFYYILHKGTDGPSRQLLIAAGVWQSKLHDEILVYDQGYWRKDHDLWVEVQKADWKDVILEQERKDAMHKDIYGFFKSEHVYKELAIPWKRGIIMYGPPGNGKTISIKAIMKECEEKGFSPLYVKSFKSWMGEEAAMQQVFSKARSMSPCVLILEDIDALINDSNRSYFLNQLDGFEGNDGILVIVTTNHFTRLDPAISTRPSRFDRKYLFDDPNEAERTLYAQYWQKKLASNKSIDFPDSLVKEVAQETDKFSFAYLKEAFVSTLFLIATNEDTKTHDFATVLKDTIKKLRDDLKKSPHDDDLWTHSRRSGSSGVPALPFPDHSLMTGHGNNSRSTTQVDPSSSRPLKSDGRPQVLHNGRDMRSLAISAAKLGRQFIF